MMRQFLFFTVLLGTICTGDSTFASNFQEDPSRDIKSILLHFGYTEKSIQQLNEDTIQRSIRLGIKVAAMDTIKGAEEDDFDFIRDSFPNAEFWNFKRENQQAFGVIMYPDSDGFFDVKITKNIADLIVLASNYVGFSEQLEAKKEVSPNNRII